MPKLSLEERFDDKWICSTGGCFEWTGQRNHQGRARMKVDGLMTSASRVAWFLGTGAWPSLYVLHRCDNPGCVRFTHLFLGTQTDNMRDCVKKNRLNDRRGTKNPRSKLSSYECLLISELLESGLTLSRIAAQFNISIKPVHEIKRGRHWSCG